MANSLSPSFFPTTASAYATYPPPLLPDGYYPAPFPYTFPSYPAPAPDFIPVPAYGTPSLPSATNYQQPFPFTPLPFPYAAAYPYPPPASAYTPASSFYPAQPYGPSTFSYATTSPCPTSEATPIPTNVEPNWPPPAPEPSPITPTSTPHATSSTPTYDSGQFSPPPPVETPTIAPPGPPDQHPGAPLPTDLSRATQQRLDSIPTITTREHYKHQRLASSKLSDWSFPTPSTKLSSSRVAFASENCSSMSSSSVSATGLPRQVDSHVTSTKSTYLASSDDAVTASAQSMVTQVAAPAHPTGAHTAILSEMEVGLTKMPSASDVSPRLSPATSASTKLGRRSAFLGITGTTYVAPQVFGEMPKPYGLHNLNGQSVILANGTKHSYFTLPEDYSLEQANPPMPSPAEKNVSVIVPLPVDAQEAGLAPVLCSKTNNTTGSDSLLVPNLQLPINVQDASQVFKETSAYDIYEEDRSCLDIISNVQDFTFQLQQQDDERACNISVLNAADSVAKRSSQLSVEYSKRESRLLWDPGATKFPVLFMTVAGAAKLQGTDVHKSEFTSSNAIQKLLNSLVNVNEMIPWPFWKLQLSTTVMGYSWSVLFFWDGLLDTVWASKLSITSSVWDPGILNQMDIMPEETAVPNLLHSDQKKFKLLNFIGKHVASKQFWAQLLLHCHSWCTTPSVFLRVQSCCLPIILDYLYSEPVKQLVCYYSIFSWTAVSLSTIVHMRLVLSAGKIVQEGRDVWDPGAATFHVRFMTADDATKLQCIDVYKSAMIQILAVKLGARNAPIFATAIMCFVAFDLRWTEMNAAAVLVQVVPYSKDTSRGS